MRKLALTWPDQQIVQQIVAQLPWGQNVTLLDKLQDDGQRLWYARAAIEHGWSRDILVHQIETRLHERQGRAITNFDATMEPVWAAAAADLFKDPYVLDFVDIAEDAHERHLEKALIERIKDLLLELGKGFSFMGSQYRLDVAGQDYYLDLLFYHTRLHSLRGHRS
jgi:predicted nuclease of restriction endonuclease-like (RecB) superfamily